MIVCAGSSCDEYAHKPQIEGGTPDPVSNVRVENLAGAAEIYYTLPDEEVSYVMAEYGTKAGEHKVAKSSIYKKSLRVEGFPSAGEYTVTLYAVGRSERRSEPISVKVNPETPPYLATFESLQVLDDFGGITVLASNDYQADLAVGVVTPDSTGRWVSAGTYYTKMENVRYSLRGYEPEKRKFGVFIQDRWGNTSDTLYSDNLPLFEEEIDRTDFREVRLPTDTYQGHSNGRLTISLMFNDIINNNLNCFHTIPLSGIPQHFTFDMGITAKLSRFRLWHRWGLYFNAGNPKRFEVWGSNDPNPDGSWESWTKLGEYVSQKPSGLPIGELSAEDNEYMLAGEEFLFDVDNPPVRYLRFRILETWLGVDYISIQKLAFWGSIQE